MGIHLPVDRWATGNLTRKATMGGAVQSVGN